MKKFALLALVILLAGGAFAYQRLRPRYLNESELYSEGQVKANAGHLSEAIRYYKVLLKKAPRHSPAMSLLYKWQLSAGETRDATDTLEHLTFIEERPEQWTELEKLYTLTGQLDKAEALQKRRLKLEAASQAPQRKTK